MNDRDPADAVQQPPRGPQTLDDTIRALRALRAEMRAHQASQNLRRYPNASRGARIAGVPLSKLPPHLRSADTAWDGDGDE